MCQNNSNTSALTQHYTESLYSLSTFHALTRSWQHHNKTAVSHCTFASQQLQLFSSQSSCLNTGSSAKSLACGKCVVLSLKPCDHTTPALWEMHLLPITAKLDYKLYKCVCVSSHLWFTFPGLDSEVPTYKEH